MLQISLDFSVGLNEPAKVHKLEKRITRLGQFEKEAKHEGEVRCTSDLRNKYLEQIHPIQRDQRSLKCRCWCLCRLHVYKWVGVCGLINLSEWISIKKLYKMLIFSRHNLSNSSVNMNIHFELHLKGYWEKRSRDNQFLIMKESWKWRWCSAGRGEGTGVHTRLETEIQNQYLGIKIRSHPTAPSTAYYTLCTKGMVKKKA